MYSLGCCLSFRFEERLRLSDRLRLLLVNDLKLSRQLVRDRMLPPLVTCPGPASLGWLASQYLNKNTNGVYYLEQKWCILF